MKALALAAALSIALTAAAIAQDSKPSHKSNGVTRQPAEAAATIDTASIQRNIETFSNAIKADPKNDKFLAARGQSYIRLGRYDEAIADLTAAISLCPSNQGYFEVRGDAFAKSHRDRNALSDYSKALALGPPSHYLYKQRAGAAVVLNDFSTAESSAKSALELKPRDVKTLLLLGYVEYELGRYEESLKFLNQANSIDSQNVDVLKQRAEAYLKVGKATLAEKDNQLARKLSAGGR